VQDAPPRPPEPAIQPIRDEGGWATLRSILSLPRFGILLCAASAAAVSCADDEPTTLSVVATGGTSAGFGSHAGGSGAAGGEAGQAGSTTDVAGAAGGPVESSGAGGASGMAGSHAGAPAAGQAGAAGGGGEAGSEAGGGAGSSSSSLPKECGTVPFFGECDEDSLRFCERSHYEGDAALPPRIVTRACGDASTCTLREGTAFCAPASVCLPNETTCHGQNDLATCSGDGKAYGLTPCDLGERCLESSVGTSCVPPPSTGGAETVIGCVTYERQPLTATGYGPSVVAPAPYLTVSIYEEGASSILGRAQLDASGCFEAVLSKRPSADVVVHLVAALPRSAAGQDLDDTTPLLGVAHLSNQASPPDDPVSTGYWQWSNRDTGCGDDSLSDRAVVLDAEGPGRHRLGRVDHDPSLAPGTDWLLRETCGSGAVHILQRTREALARVTANHLGYGSGAGEIVRQTEDVRPLSILALWEPGLEPACGSCTSATNSGPFLVPRADGGTDSYELTISLAGTAGTPTHWASSVLTHEMGHWAMASYSRPPGEGGIHFASGASKPGLAYSEGWATAFGQWALSTPSLGVWDPVYVDRQDGTTFFFDIETMSWSSGMLPSPAPGASVDAPINENAVASMIFALGAPATAIQHGQGLGPDAWFRALTSSRLLGSVGRGYFRRDLLDFFDAGRCSGAFPDASITAVAAPQNFPWDHDPLCD
jgi:hypothetical protein